MSRQDRQGVRTATDLERKYNFGKSFEEVMSAARVAEKTAVKAQETAEEAKNAVKETHSEILKLSDSITLSVTNGEPGGTALIKLKVDDTEYTGEIDLHGVVTFTNLREQGATEINGDNIVTGTISADRIDVENLFSQNITMNGKFTNTAEVFLEPGLEEWETIKKHILHQEIIPDEKIPLYDFNGDGKVNSADMQSVKSVMLGMSSLAEWSGAVKSTVTMEIDMTNPQKSIRMYGTNMWGRFVDVYIGINDNDSSFASRKYVDATFPMMEHQEVTLGSRESATLTFSGTVEAVNVTIMKEGGRCISGFWTKANSGVTNSLYGRLDSGDLSNWNTTVTIDGNNVTITRGGSDSLIHYVTAFVKQ